VIIEISKSHSYCVRLFENRVLRRILDLRGRKWQEAREDCVMRSFITCRLLQTKYY
jgi:hypothetical protein